ncbi:methylated-DNA--[protein]-cysteine S-methyltransferase [candidate division KSB1 bacterium]|nr:methylated-DNA--[protein]-cysteine S-methyltransferase [candidate division KSB1 bacterium]
MKTNYAQSAEDYQRIANAITFIEKNFRRQPSLDEVAASVYLSEHHFQRLFSRWVGISPKRFLQFLTKEYAKKLLAHSSNLLDVTFASGLSSPGRLHELFVTCEAMTPGEYKSEGEGLAISYGFHPTPFGECLLALTERGICALQFVKQGRKQVLAWLKKKWPRARLQHAPAATQPYITRIFSVPRRKASRPLHLLVEGTNFQIKVWEALLKIPAGALVSYQDVAGYLGVPQASRAVGNAVANNPITYIIPCHRVVRKAGALGNYSGGATRKKALLAWEAAKVNGRAE